MLSSERWQRATSLVIQTWQFWWGAVPGYVAHCATAAPARQGSPIPFLAQPAFSPNEVRLHDVVKDEPLVALEFPAEVLRVVVNAALYVAFRQRCWMGRCTVSWPLRSFCALTGDNKVYVVDISNMKVVHSFDVCPHPSSTDARTSRQGCWPQRVPSPTPQGCLLSPTTPSDPS